MHDKFEFLMLEFSNNFGRVSKFEISGPPPVDRFRSRYMKLEPYFDKKINKKFSCRNLYQ